MASAASVVVLIYFTLFGVPLVHNIWNYLYRQKRYQSPLLLGFYFSASLLFVSRVVQFTSFALFDFRLIPYYFVGTVAAVSSVGASLVMGAFQIASMTELYFLVKLSVKPKDRVSEQLVVMTKIDQKIKIMHFVLYFTCAFITCLYTF